MLTSKILNKLFAHSTLSWRQTSTSSTKKFHLTNISQRDYKQITNSSDYVLGNENQYIRKHVYSCNSSNKYGNITLSDKQMDSYSKEKLLHQLFLIISSRNDNGAIERIGTTPLLNLLKEATIPDIATICLAHFKTKRRINDPRLLSKIIDKTCDLITHINPREPGYCAIIKSIRYSNHLALRFKDNLKSLFDKMMKEKPQIILTSPYNLVQTVKLFESIRLENYVLMDILKSQMFNNLSRFRIKDIQYALTSLTNSSHNDLKLDQTMRANLSRLCTTICDETRSDRDMQYRHMVPLLRALTMLSYYNDDLISYTNKLLLDETWVSRMEDIIEFNRSVLLIHVATKLENPNGVTLGNAKLLHRLSDSISRTGNYGSLKPEPNLNHLKFILSNFQSRNRNYFRISESYRSIAQRLAASEHLADHEYKFNFQCTMPHQNYADLVITKNYSAMGSFDGATMMPHRVPKGQKHFLLLAVSNHDYVDNNKKLSGYKLLNKRLLEHLGYNVLFFDISESDVEQVSRRIKSNLDHVE